MSRELEALQALGLTAHQARAYQALSELGTATAYRVAQVASLPAANTYDALRRLAALGGAQLLPGRPRRWRAAEPQAWLTAVAEDLARQAREAAVTLAARAAAPETAVEGERRGAAARRLLAATVEGAFRLLAVEAPPATVAAFEKPLHDAGLRGVRIALIVLGGSLPFPAPAGWLAVAAPREAVPPYGSLWAADRDRSVRYAGAGALARARLVADPPFAAGVTRGILARIGWVAASRVRDPAARRTARSVLRLLREEA